MVFGPLCRRADGALKAFAETRSGRTRVGTFSPGSRPRWRRAPRELIAAHYSPACDRVVEVYYAFGALVRGGDRVVRLKAAYRGEPREVAWSPDGTRVAVMMIEPDYGSTIRVFDARTGRRLARRLALGDLPPQAFSPDGNALVYTDADRLTVLDVRTNTRRVIAETARAPAWSPKGDRIAAVNGDGDIELIDPALGSGPTVMTAGLFTQEIVWSPDGGTLALRYRLDGRNGLAFVAAGPGAQPRRALAPSRHLQTPLWSPDSAAVTVTR
jgi:Tol biopolymer transport system component